MALLRPSSIITLVVILINKINLTHLDELVQPGNIEDGIENDSNNSENESLSLEPLFLDAKTIKAAIIPTMNDVKFFLYKGENKVIWEEINLENLKLSGLKPKRPYKIAVHGFLANCTSTDFPTEIFKAYIKQKSNNNLVCVDWGSLANPVKKITGLLHYPQAVEYTEFVGEMLERFIENILSKKFVQDSGDIHLIGSSLGAHISGFSGHELFARKKVKVGRISGLDPAGPYFYSKGKNDKTKLSKSDAIFVDVLSSNMGRLGSSEDLGHVKFLPNGGAVQPFCKQDNLFDAIKEIWLGDCSHAAAKAMFAKSIKEPLIACLCTSWKAFVKSYSKTNKCNSKVELFGDKVSMKARGKYCLYLKNL